MKIKNQKKIKIENRSINIQIGMLTAGFAGFMALMTGLQISKYTFNEFDNVCKHVGYNDCMRWFWQTKGFFQTAEVFSIVVLVASLIFVMVNKKEKSAS